MPKLPSLHAPLLKGLHWAGYGALIAAGYKLELRRNGDLKLGLWRKSFERKSVKVEGVKTRKKGTPRRLVIIPGFGDSPMSWLPSMALMRPVLRHKYDEIIFFDFPG